MLKHKDNADLKRPDLRGVFVCVSCNQTFQHNASLNRHRQKQHSDVHTCLICDMKMEKSDCIRLHMKTCHNLDKIYTCGCCNWSFFDRKQQMEHCKSMEIAGTPGPVIPIAKSGNKPGSLLQTLCRTPKFNNNEHIIKKEFSLSPTTTESCSSSSTEYHEPSSSPTPSEATEDVELEEKSQFSNVFNNAVDLILKKGIFSGEQLTQPDTWETIIGLANALVHEYELSQKVIAKEDIGCETMENHIKLE